MKHTFMFAGLLAWASSASAALYFSDSFAYDVGSALTSPYTQHGSNDMVVGSSGLSLTGVPSTGLALQAVGGGREVSAPLSQSFSLIGTGETQSLYLGFLVQMTGDSTWGYGQYVGIGNGSLTNRDGFYVGMNKMGGTTHFGGAIGRPSYEDFQFGDTIAPGSDTYYVVAKFEWVADPRYVSVTDGMKISMSVFEEGESIVEPTVWDNVYSEDRSYPWEQPSALLDTLSVYGGATPITSLFDEIRVGDSFNAVAVPEPSAIAVIMGLAVSLFTFRRRRSR